MLRAAYLVKTGMAASKPLVTAPVVSRGVVTLADVCVSLSLNHTRPLATSLYNYKHMYLRSMMLPKYSFTNLLFPFLPPNSWLLQARKAAAEADAPPVQSTKYNYVHNFCLVEHSYNDFMKQLAGIESRLTDKFGSTFNLRVCAVRPVKEKKVQFLRSAFVHKRAQDHWKWVRNHYYVKVSYTFELNDGVLNDYVYKQLKYCISGAGTVRSSGYEINQQ